MERHDAILRIYLFGNCLLERQLSDGTWEEVPLAAWKGYTYPRSLLKYLARCPERKATRSAIFRHLGPEAGDPEGMLNSAALLIRKACGRQVLQTFGRHRDGGYQLADQSLVWVDADACLALIKQAEQHEEATLLERRAILEQACVLFQRGPLLQDEEDVWCYAERGFFEKKSYQCRLWLAEVYEQQGQFDQAEALYSGLLVENLADETALRRLLTLLQRQGMAHLASKRYQELKRLFKVREGGNYSAGIEAFAGQIQHEPLITISVPRYMTVRRLEEHTTQEIRESMEHIESLSLFAELTSACRHLSEGSELAAAERILWTYLPSVEAIARRSLQDQQGAAHIAAQGYLLAASLAGHRNDLEARRHYSEEAMLFGKLAGDCTLQITALRQLAITLDYLSQPDEILHIYQQALPYLSETSTLLSACIYADMAGTYTQLANEKKASHFLELAYEHFPEKPEQEPEYLSTICRRATLLLCDGLQKLGFGHPVEAVSVFAQIDGKNPSKEIPERVRIDIMNCQAEAFLALNEIDQACLYLDLARSTSVTIGSQRRLQESYILLKQMETVWPHEPQMKKLHGLFLQHFVNHAE